ncbi:hypothetical protein QBC39DRAFT_365011 [Podospora conica]|nr:hypothetical protein QBC39DRAFT_365011 [Schizothecium conicum]
MQCVNPLSLVASGIWFAVANATLPAVDNCAVRSVGLQGSGSVQTLWAGGGPGRMPGRCGQGCPWCGVGMGMGTKARYPRAPPLSLSLRLVPCPSRDGKLETDSCMGGMLGCRAGRAVRSNAWRDG